MFESLLSKRRKIVLGRVLRGDDSLQNGASLYRRVDGTGTLAGVTDQSEG